MGAGLAIEFSMPVLAQRLHARLPVDVSHVPERFALFTLIVLGESIAAVALGTADTNWRIASASCAVLGFFGAAGLWWIYFDRGAAAGLDSTGSMQVYVRIHIPLLAALTAFGAGVRLLIEGSGDAGARWAFCGGAALYLVCLTVAQRLTTAGVPSARARAAAAVALAALAVAAPSPVPVAGAGAAVLAALVGFEVRAPLRDSQASGTLTP